MSIRTLSCVLAAGLITTTAAAETPRDQLIMAKNIDAISTFDPAEIGETVTVELLRNSCENLVSTLPGELAALVPGLAKSWDISDDGMTITFHLDEDAVFASGNPLTAADVVWSLKRVLQMGYRNAQQMRTFGFDTDNMDDAFQSLDDHTFQLKLQAAFAPDLVLHAVINHFMAVPLDRVFLESVEADGDMGNAYLKTHTACAGPYTLRQWTAGEVVVLEQNESYWKEPPALRRIITLHIPEPGAQRLALERGDIDVARNIIAADIPDFEANPDIRVESVVDFRLQYLSFNTARKPFDDPRVIEAIRYMIDYKGLEQTAMRGLGVQRNVGVPFGPFGALPIAEGTDYSLDLDKARALLAEAGYADGFSATIFLANDGLSPPIAQHLAANASELGITFSIQQMATSELFSRFRGREFDSAMSNFGTPLPDASYHVSIFAANPDNSEEAKLTQLVTWRTSWANEHMNELADAALEEADPAKREQIYFDLQREHMRISPTVFLFQLISTTAVRKEVSVYPVDALNVFYSGIKK